MKRFYFGVLLFIGLLIGLVATGGTNTLSSVSGGLVRTSHVNQFYTALNQDIVPRNSSGVATSNGGSLGSTTKKFLKLFVSSGGWVAGDIKMHHTYNGTVTCGQGWMLADGRVINEANYDAETGRSAGDWDTYVGTSPLDGKYLPNMTDKYPVGKAATAQAGTIAITTVGNSSNQVNLQHNHGSHTHTVPDHYHQWLSDSGVNAHDLTYYDTGSTSATQLLNTKSKNAYFGIKTCTSSSDCLGGNSSNNLFTYLADYGSGSSTTSSTTPTNDLSTTQSIQPHSIEVQYCMRVIE